MEERAAAEGLGVEERRQPEQDDDDDDEQRGPVGRVTLARLRQVGTVTRGRRHARRQARRQPQAEGHGGHGVGRRAAVGVPVGAVRPEARGRERGGGGGRGPRGGRGGRGPRGALVGEVALSVLVDVHVAPAVRRRVVELAQGGLGRALPESPRRGRRGAQTASSTAAQEGQTSATAAAATKQESGALAPQIRARVVEVVGPRDTLAAASVVTSSAAATALARAVVVTVVQVVFLFGLVADVRPGGRAGQAFRVRRVADARVEAVQAVAPVPVALARQHPADAVPCPNLGSGAMASARDPPTLPVTAPGKRTPRDRRGPASSLGRSCRPRRSCA